MSAAIISNDDIREFRRTGKVFVKEWKVRGANPAINWKKMRGERRQAMNFMITKLCTWLPPSRMKNWLYRRIGVSIGRNVSISPDVFLDPIYPDLIKIKDNVILGWGSVIFTHELTPTKIRIGSVVIEENSMISEHSLVRPGVRVGKNSVVAAMTYVNKDIGSYEMVGGVPEHLIKRIKRNQEDM